MANTIFKHRPRTIRRAIERARTRYVDHSSNDADVVLQFAAFGEVIYG